MSNRISEQNFPIIIHTFIQKLVFKAFINSMDLGGGQWLNMRSTQTLNRSMKRSENRSEECHKL